MLENDVYIAGIGQAVLDLLSFKFGSGNHQIGISLLQKFSDIFGNRELTILGRERRPRLQKTKTAITEIKAVQLCRKQFERPFI